MLGKSRKCCTHVECDMFLRICAVPETGLYVRLAGRHFPEVMENAEKRRKSLDNELQRGPHIAELAKMLSFGAYAFEKIRNLSNIQFARLVYFCCFLVPYVAQCLMASPFITCCG
ncbi:hypothetical protein EVAR_95808_1 [Eumeta japonica]|uniref:Uncharacterized protein n=1 Tax=Eumeta variegata TaxID=151549 RepID=A0A4C1W0T7_EUMVA|nr:hypothetical protein EVAR_95808_1 [Eumeta japonica]